MYDELVKRLRSSAEGLNSCDECNGECNGLCIFVEAADAIETLATNYDAATDIMKHQTEYIEELERERDSANEAATALYGALPKWIPVTERLPKNDQDVLVMVHWRDYPEDMMCYGRKHKTRWYLWNGELGEIIKGFDITHWMPLPEPPREEI